MSSTRLQWHGVIRGWRFGTIARQWIGTRGTGNGAFGSGGIAPVAIVLRHGDETHVWRPDGQRMNQADLASLDQKLAEMVFGERVGVQTIK